MNDRIVLSRTDNGVVMAYGRRGPQPSELKVYDFAAGGRQALAERLRAVLVEGEVPGEPAAERRRVIITPAANGAIAQSGRETPRVFTDLAALRDWLKAELDL